MDAARRDGRVGGVPVFGVPLSTAMAAVSMFWLFRVYLRQTRSLRFWPLMPLSMVAVSASVTRAYRPSTTRLRTGISA